MSNNTIGQGASMASIGSSQPGKQASNIEAISNSKGIASGSEDKTQIISRPRLQELVQEVDPTVQLDDDVEEMLLELADSFIDSTLNAAATLAKHRQAPTVELKDVQIHLERNWNMWIPGFGNEELRPYKRAAVTEAHKQRTALIRKTMKKY